MTATLTTAGVDTLRKFTPKTEILNDARTLRRRGLDPDVVVALLANGYLGLRNYGRGEVVVLTQAGWASRP